MDTFEEACMMFVALFSLSSLGALYFFNLFGDWFVMKISSSSNRKDK